MATALAMDLRSRVLRDVDAGLSAEKAAEKYSVSARTIYHWKALRRETGSLEPRDGKTGPKPKLAEHRARILAAVRDDAGITLHDLKTKLQLPACVATVWAALRTWGLVLKKKSCAPLNNSGRMSSRSVAGGTS